MDDSNSAALAVVIGAGGIGGAFAEALAPEMQVLSFSRPALDLQQEASIVAAATHIKTIGEPRLIVIATGFLHGNGFMPEKTFATLSPEHLAHSFAVNATGPALAMKHLLPLLPRHERSVFVTISAKVGSIGDNAYGGWYSYRASKAALNQLTHTAAIELKHKKPGAICIALHPGTVDTKLSGPFAKAGLNVRPPARAAADMLAVLHALTPEQSGGFFDYTGAALPW